MVNVYPVDINGERDGLDREIETAHWDKLKTAPHCRWRKADKQRPSQTEDSQPEAPLPDPNQKTDGEKAVMEIGGKPSKDYTYTEAIALIKRLDNIQAVEYFTRNDTTRKKVKEARDKRIEQLKPNDEKTP